MFSFPVTLLVRTDESVYSMPVHVAIDDIAVVKPLLDNSTKSGVESYLYSPLPNSEIILVDGRRLPVLEMASTIYRYLDAYRSLDDFFTQRRPSPLEEDTKGAVIPLFKADPCATSEASTPD